MVKQNKIGARELAVKALLKVNTAGVYSSVAISEVLENAEADERDAALASVLFYGVLERKLTLDYVISLYSQKAVAKLDTSVREILRMSLYSLLYMDKIPHSAAVNEGVKLCRKFKKTSAQSFVNGVLRNFLRADLKYELPAGFGVAQSFSVKYSCELWLVEELMESYGEAATKAILEEFLNRPKKFLRLNTTKTTADELIKLLAGQGFAAVKDEILSDCLVLETGGDIAQSSLYYKGFFHMQDRSSQLAAHVLAPQKGENVYDCCAAPGGKTATIAELMQNTGSVLATELHPQRKAEMDMLFKRLGLGIIKTEVADASDTTVKREQFDSIICDLPCSGIGTARRKPEIKYKTKEELAELPDNALKILEAAAANLKPGGRLVYSTCTLRKAENEEVLEQFLSRNPEFEPLPLPKFLNAKGHHITILPANGADGFFISTVTRK